MLKNAMPSRTPSQIGIDFGTSNTVIAMRFGNLVEVLQLGTASTYPTLLFFEAIEGKTGTSLQSWAGAAAIAEYTAYGGGRLLQSLKSHLASSAFSSTNIYGTNFTLPDLIVRFLSHAMADMNVSLADVPCVVGRPVRFVAAAADENLAMQRLTESFTRAGAKHLHFVAEPVAAASAFAQRCTKPTNVLIADLGGGTSDFSVVTITPQAPTPQLQVLATGGVGMAGDDCDAAIIKHVIAPYFGANTLLQNGQLPPRWLYDQLARWHYLSLLRSPQNLRLLRDLANNATNPEPFEFFRSLVEENAGFAMAKAVQAAKAALTTATSVDLKFNHSTVTIRSTIQRAAFEDWIQPVLQAIEQAMLETLAAAGVGATEIDYVFMTGGTSFVPAIRQLMQRHFLPAIIANGDEFISVANGLARHNVAS